VEPASQEIPIARTTKAAASEYSKKRVTFEEDLRPGTTTHKGRQGILKENSKYMRCLGFEDDIGLGNMPIGDELKTMTPGHAREETRIAFYKKTMDAVREELALRKAAIDEMKELNRMQKCKLSQMCTDRPPNYGTTQQDTHDTIPSTSLRGNGYRFGDRPLSSLRLGRAKPTLL
jgi:hypothetical protein